MPRRRSPRLSKLKAAEWDQYVRVKKGEATYTVQRKATPEAKERYACGVSPFGVKFDTTSGVKNHVGTSITRQAMQILIALHGRENGLKIYGIEEDMDKVGTAKEGFYSALVQISLVAKDATRPSTETTSQLTGRKYFKWPTRSGSIPIGRGDLVLTKTANSGVTIADIDEIDFLYAKILAEKQIADAVADAAKPNKKGLSFDPEIWQPSAATLPPLKNLTTPGTLSFS